MTLPVRKFTHLGRIVSFAYPTHRVLIGLCALAGIAGWLVAGAGAGATAATVFLAWALSREIDPDRPGLSLVAAAGAGGLVVATGATSLAGLGMAMLAARIVARSTGASPLLTDIGAVGVAAGIVSRTPLGWSTGLGVAAAIALDTMLERPAPRPHAWLALAVGVAVTLAAVLSGALPQAWTPPEAVTLAAVAAVVALAVTAGRRPPMSEDDRGDPLVAERVVVARWTAVASVALGALAGGAPAAAAWPALVALLVSLSPTRR